MLTNSIYQKIAPSAIAGDLARLARLYLAVPATPAPLERICSRALRILTLKRANLKAKLSQRMMFITENLSGLHKYYGSLAKHDTTEDKYFLIELEKTYLPPLGGGDGDDNIDVGQNDE
jgi:hypothetical protein